MVCSQVYSQHPSQCVHSNVHQRRSLVLNNAEVHFQEPETSDFIRLGSTTPDCQFLSSKSYTCSNYGNITSPFKSSWIQRLIPSHNLKVEEPQPSDKIIRETHGIDVSETSWKENADHPTILGNKSNFTVYENSRRSKQDVVRSHQTYLGPGAQRGLRTGAKVRPVEAREALPPEIQVSPKLLPVVESLLPGHSKKGTKIQTCAEANMPHILPRCTGVANPMKQTVHYSADGKSRVSCSSIEGLNCHCVGCAAGHSCALTSSQEVKTCIGPLQLFNEFSFNSIDAVTLSNMVPSYGSMERQENMNLRTHLNSTQTEYTFVTRHNRSRNHELFKSRVSSLARCQSIENRLSDEYSMPCREEATERDQRLPFGLSMNQLVGLNTVSMSNCRNFKGHHSYAHNDSEALYARREGPFDEGWWSLPNTEKDKPGQISKLVPSQCRSNVAKEKADVCSSHHVIEPDLSSSHCSYEEQGGTSRSFSFHFENQSAAEFDHSKVFTRRGPWPFGPLPIWNEDLVQSRRSEENVVRGRAEATRLGLPVDNSAFFVETGVCATGTAYIGRSQSSPFFGTQKLNESASCMVCNKGDVSPYNSACIDIGGVSSEKMSGEEVLPGKSVDHVGQTQQGGYPLSRLESSLMIEGVEGKELTLPFPSRTPSVTNLKEFKASFQSSMPTCSPQTSPLNHTDGNCVSVSNWKAIRPPIRSSTLTCSPEAAQSNHADGNLCCSTGSIGNCKRPSNLCSEDPSTSTDARSRPVAPANPVTMHSVALLEQPHSSQTHCAVTRANTAADDRERESEGKDVIDCEEARLAVHQNVWIKRWSTVSSKEVQAGVRPNREGRHVSGMRHGRHCIENDCTSQGDPEFLHRFNQRPAKRVCYDRSSDLHLEERNAPAKACSVAVGRETDEKAGASHFMKRFCTLNAAAMAVMGRTARKAHATKRQSGGVFGVWAWNASLRKQPSGARAEECKQFLRSPNCKEEMCQSVTEAPCPTSVDR